MVQLKTDFKMKTEIFYTAIYHRNRIKFLYNFQEITIDPYFISSDKNGRKVIYGKFATSNEIKMFEFYRISNIKILQEKFFPVIPVMAFAN